MGPEYIFLSIPQAQNFYIRSKPAILIVLNQRIMNKITIIILFMSMSVASCTKSFLKEEPKDELSTDQFFQQPAHAFSAVNALYRNGAPQFFDGSHYSGTRMMLGQWMSGFFDNEYKGQEIHVQHTQQLTLNGNNL